MTETLITIKDIVKQFANAIREANFMELAGLLFENGEFDTQDKELEIIESGKSEFIKWITVQRSLSTITDIDYDQCLHCKIGAPVVLFNKGMFPRQALKSYERSKTGLMLDVKGGLIHTIKFCYVFVKTEN